LQPLRRGIGDYYSACLVPDRSLGKNGSRQLLAYKKLSQGINEPIKLNVCDVVLSSVVVDHRVWRARDTPGGEDTLGTGPLFQGKDAIS
jgi:hypothetical protein